MRDDSESPYRRLVEMLPDYACGVIWLLDVALVTAVTTTPAEAKSASTQIAAIIKPFQIPEIAVGFLLVIACVMLPYSLARALNPVAVAILNTVRDVWYVNRQDSSVSDEHLEQFKQALVNRGLPLPTRSFHLAVLPYLVHLKSSTILMLNNRRRDLLEQAYLAFPVSILVALGTFALSPRNGVGATLATAAGFVVLGVTVHRAQMALVRWHAEALFVFLVVSNLTRETTSTQGGLTPR